MKYQLKLIKKQVVLIKNSRNILVSIKYQIFKKQEVSIKTNQETSGIN